MPLHVLTQVDVVEVVPCNIHGCIPTGISLHGTSDADTNDATRWNQSWTRVSSWFWSFNTSIQVTWCTGLLLEIGFNYRFILVEEQEEGSPALVIIAILIRFSPGVHSEHWALMRKCNGPVMASLMEKGTGDFWQNEGTKNTLRWCVVTRSPPFLDFVVHGWKCPAEKWCEYFTLARLIFRR